MWQNDISNGNKITLLHLSDFHFCEENRGEIQSILDSISSDLKTLNEEKKVIPNLAVISGDVADKGHKDDYNFALSSLKKLFKQLKIPLERVFIVPGNHDINRADLAKFNKITFNDEDSVARFLSSSSDEMEITFKKLENFYGFIEQFYGKSPYNGNYYFVKTLQIGNKSVGIVGLNSTWFSGEKRYKEDGSEIVVDAKELIIGEFQAKEAYQAIGKTDFCITVMHHPFSYLKDFDEGLIKRIVMQNSNIILHGHVHSSSAVEIIEPDSRCITFSAGASYIRGRSKRYNICEITLDDLSYKVHLRLYSDENKFWAKDTLTYQSGEGIIEGKIWSGDVVEERQYREYPFKDLEPSIEKFIRLYWRNILGERFQKEGVLKLRRAFFKKSGENPSLHTIAYSTIQYLLENKILTTKKELEKIFNNKFIFEQINTSERESILLYFDDGYFSRKQKDIIFESKLDISRLKDREFLSKKEEEIAQKYKKAYEEDLKQKKEDLEETKKKIEEEYKKFKSKIEDFPTLSDDELPKLKKVVPIECGLWYDGLGLKENPFPSHIGLENIKEELYDDIIVKTSIFDMFDREIMKSPESLLKKSFLIYGVMGSGKTTLFKYLQKAISILIPNTLTLLVPLEAQSDFERIRYDFYQKLYEKLESFYFSRVTYPTGIEKTTLNDSAIYHLFEDIRKIAGIDKFIVFIDDLHKHPNYMKEVFEFISGLQIFRAYMYENDINLSIFIAGDLSWISDADGIKAFGGSIDVRGKIPEITTTEATEMINKRLKVYAIKPTSPPTIKLDYIETIFKILKARLPVEITFRDVIEEVEKHWMNHEFESLKLSLILDYNTLSNMILDMDADHPVIKDKFDRLWEYSEKDEAIFNQFITILENLYLNGGVYEDTREFEDNKDYYGHLFRLEIISRRSRRESFMWDLTNQVKKMFEKFSGKYGFKPSEYFSKLYLTDEKKYISEESSRMSMILKTGGSYGEYFLKQIKEALEGYRLVFKFALSIQEEFDDRYINDLCKSSIAALMKATLIVCENKIIKADLVYDIYKEFEDNWFESSELTEYIDGLHKMEAKETKPTIMDVRATCNDYFRAMKSLVSNIQRFMKYNNVFFLESKYLYVNDKKTLNAIRRHIFNENYSMALEKANLFAAQKLRDLTYIMNCLIYGVNKWRRGLPTGINEKLKGEEERDYIEKSILNKLSLVDLTNIYQSLDYMANRIIEVLFSKQDWDNIKEIIFLEKEMQSVTSDSKVNKRKDEILNYILQAKILAEKINNFFYLFFMDRIPFIKNYKNFGIPYTKLSNRDYWLGDYKITKEDQEKIKIRIDKEKKIELDLNKYIPNESFHDLNFMDWVMHIYDMKININAISVSISPDGTIIIS